MLAEIGYFSLWMAFLAALYAVAAAVIGEWRRIPALAESARNAVLVAFTTIFIAIGVLFIALVIQEYQIKYVWEVSNPSMPLFFRVTALWGSQAGSLLFWSFLMGLFAAVAVLLNWRSHRRLMPYAIAYMMAVLAFFIGLSLFLENPFLRYWISTDGNVVMSVLPAVGDTAPTVTRLAETAKGLNPLLRHFGMAIHPPMLYLGFVSFIIPFSFAMAALASGELSTNWIKASRRWTLVAWIFLSLGLVLGGRWAYDVLGWGGYWGWDPVENAAFLPWLMGTAFLHSIMIQEKRGMLKTWNMFLSIGTFSAVIFGTFATRSGLVESVHSFARSGIGFPMFFFWLSLTLISVSLILWRQSQGMLQAEHSFTSLLSRETLFVVNNLVFISLFAIIFWWSFGMPIISELFFDTVTTYGPETFNTYTPWLFLALYILMGIAPLSAWGATSLSRLGKALLVPLVLTIATVALFAFYGMNSIGAIVAYGVILPAGYVALYETYRGYRARRHIHKENPLQTLQALFRRNPRRYGGYLVHLGVTIIGIGIIGSTVFQQETQHTLSIGESMFFNGYELRYDSLETGLVSQDGRIIDRANLTLFKDGREVAPLRPRRDYFGDQGQSMTIASAHSTLQNDFYVIMVGWEEISQRTATFKIFINPLINLIWSGSLILIIGTILAAWPHPALSRQTKRSQVHSTLAKGATA